MPLVKREIQPIYLSRGLDVIPKGIGNELECVTNCTLSSVIRQLSNLARHAEDVFAELYTEANFVFKKSNALQERIESLSVKVAKFESSTDQGKGIHFSFCVTSGNSTGGTRGIYPQFASKYY